MFETRALSRVASIGLGVILLFLTGFAIWAAAATKESADEVKRSSVVSDAYRLARYALALQDRYMSEYLVKLLPGAESFQGDDLRMRHEEAAALMIDSMQTVRLNGSDNDRRLAKEVLVDNEAHMNAAMDLFEAVDEGDAAKALAIQQTRLNPGFSHMQEAVNAAAEENRQKALRQLQGLSRTEDLVFTGTVIAFTFGLLLLVAFAAVLRAYARRAEEARQAELARLEQAALTDNLTNLRNHRAFHEDLGREVERHHRMQSPLSLVLLDLDGLKKVNDSRGHQSGDEHLQAVADCLSGTIRASDAAYRIGGDEFAVVLAGEKAWGAFRLMQRLQEKLAFVSPEQLSVTAGVAEANGLSSKDVLIRNADVALIEAKRSHRGVLIYSESFEPGPAESDRAAEQHHRATLTTALARAVDAKDSYTRSHSETVSEASALIAEELGFEPEHVAKVRLAGLLHDVGKIGISDAILQKPARLTAREFEIMKAHSRLGHSIVSAAELYEEAKWILHHHERPDGSGYPEGLAGDGVPLESRIILVADAFEAMTSDRPYRRGRPEAQAFEELERHAGTQFDPECVAALRRALARAQLGSPADATLEYEVA